MRITNDNVYEVDGTDYRGIGNAIYDLIERDVRAPAAPTSSRIGVP
jgi:hypothetical protein